MVSESVEVEKADAADLLEQAAIQCTDADTAPKQGHAPDGTFLPTPADQLLLSLAKIDPIDPDPCQQRVPEGEGAVYKTPVTDVKMGLPKGAYKELQKVDRFLASFPYRLDAYQGPEVTYTPENVARVLRSYFKHLGNLAAVSRKLRIGYGTLKRWRDTIPEFKEALDAVESILLEEIHGVFMSKVLNAQERNPAWSIYYLKTHHPAYLEKPKKKVVQVDIRDRTFGAAKTAKVVQAQVLK